MSDLALPAPIASARPGLGSTLERVRQIAAQPAVAKSLPMMGLIAVLGLAAIVWMTMSQPPQRDLFRGLADADKAAVADTLKASNIAYSIDRDTGALSVSEGDFYQAKMLLAQAGLPKSAPDGDAMISSLPLGASRAVEGERLRGARELDLARTIEAIDAVESAKIHLAVEQPSVFLRDRSEPAASVMLRLHAGRTLGDAQVQAIVHLVASSVPGLAPDGVSVVDQTGRLLSRSGGDAASNASERQVEIQSQIEARYMASLAKLLTPIVGADNFAAEVHADLDFSEVQATRESYPKDTAVVRAEQGTITNDDAGGGETGGIPGALSNQPPQTAQTTVGQPATGAPIAPPTVKKTENYNRTFELGREVSVTKQPVGQVKRLTIAVALKQGKTRRTAKELAEIEQLVKGAVGFDAARGDTIALNARKFADVDPADEAGPKWWEAGWVSMLARNLSALLIAALVVFGVAKPLLKRRAMAPAAPVRPSRKAAIGSEIAAVLAHEARHDPARPVTLDMIEAAPGYANRAALIRNFVRQDPARAALVVRDLIRSDMPGGEERDG
jgi:flagellar M-ring protein FliF